MGTLASLVAFVLFYLMTAFALSWGTSRLGYAREQFLLIQQLGVVAFGLTIPIAAMLARRGRRRTLIAVASDRRVLVRDGAAIRIGPSQARWSR